MLIFEIVDFFWKHYILFLIVTLFGGSKFFVAILAICLILQTDSYALFKGSKMLEQNKSFEQIFQDYNIGCNRKLFVRFYLRMKSEEREKLKKICGFENILN